MLYYGVFAVDGNGQPVFRSAVWGSVIVGTNAPRDDGKLKPADLKKWGVSKLVFTGKLTQVVAGPVGRSMPPVYTHRLTFEIDEVLRGKDDATGIEAGGVLNASNIARQKREPTFPEGDTCLVAADFSRGSWRIVHVEKLTKKKLADAKLALKVPFGWSVKDGKLVSPWESLGKQAWPKGQDMNFTLLCEVTGRPAFLIGEAALAVEPVPPKEEIKWTNPDGDGFYSVTVSNPTDHPIEVPALLTSDQGEVLWSESLVILCQGKTYPVPQAQGVAGKLQPTLLKPNEKVSTIVNA